MSRLLNDLSSDFRPKALELIARCVERGVAVMIVDTLRTEAEHKANLAAGTSSSNLSKHLPRYLRWSRDYGLLLNTDRDKADAIDLAPYDVYQLNGPDKLQWDTKHPAWGVIGQEAERLGLRWGGRWQKPHDPGHAELVLPGGEPQLVAERARPWPAYRQV